MKMQIPKKIRTEDFDSDDQEIVNKIGIIYNTAIDEIYQILNGRIDFENLSRQRIDITISINSSGKLVGNPQIKLTLPSKVGGVICVKAINQVNPTIYPTGTPWVSWTTNQNILTITNVTNLQNNSQYLLTLEIS